MFKLAVYSLCRDVIRPDSLSIIQNVHWELFCERSAGTEDRSSFFSTMSSVFSGLSSLFCLMSSLFCGRSSIKTAYMSSGKPSYKQRYIHHTAQFAVESCWFWFRSVTIGFFLFRKENIMRTENSIKIDKFKHTKIEN